MRDVVIDDPVINSPFVEPERHFRFDDEGITSEIVPGRRISSYFMPVPRSKKKGRGGKQLVFDTEWTGDRVEENKFINQVRARVAMWRQGGHVGVTRTTRRLLDHWTAKGRGRRLFFCQLEALETAIYITEVAGHYGDGWIANDLRDANDGANPGLFRLAFKIATGGGKTAVMAMLIAWHALNKFANPQDGRYSDTFLVITPGITIRDRLRVLLPTDRENAYRVLDLVPSDLAQELHRSKVLITNFHAFLLRERESGVSRTTKRIAGQVETGVHKESPAQMVRRVCRELGSKKNIVVLNDEAHHCYRRKPDGLEEKLTREEKTEVRKREEEARVWISGIEAVRAKLGVKVVYDLSATPFFLRGSGYREGTLVPWVVSDFSLIDAIESGVVKVPRVPVSDTAMIGEQPTFRDLWLRIRDDLPKKGRGTKAEKGPPKLPQELEAALHALYEHYKVAYTAWDANAAAREKGLTAPVFIVVCQNTNHSKMVYDYISGYATDHAYPDGAPVYAEGALPILSNVRDGRLLHRPNSILIDSEQLDSGEAMSREFKAVAQTEIAEFKRELRERFPGRSAEDLSDEDLLREVMNTVGKPGKLGEHVKGVVSVSMLTEGWDANTVTHVLGVRAFGTQLLCEQVVGRGLRRMSYAPAGKSITVNGMTHEIETFRTEYAEVFGVPFSFIPTAGSGTKVEPGPQPTRVRALEERADAEIRFPRVAGYRFVLPRTRLRADFDEGSKVALSDQDVPTKTENAPIVGETTIMTLDDLKARRRQEVAFLIAKLVVERYFPVEEAESELGTDHGRAARVQHWLFPDVVAIAKRWLNECVTCKGNAFTQMLLLRERAHDAADRIYQAIVRAAQRDDPEAQPPVLMPILRAYDAEGTTRYVDFDTTRATYRTDPDKCHVSHVVADTESWEQKMAQVLEDMPEVVRYVKNHNVGFAIPYVLNGEERQYVPDFIAHMDDGHGPDDPLRLVVEVSGEARKDKAVKAETARTLWVPAVNNSGGFGRWTYLEITDPWDAEREIRAILHYGAKKSALKEV